jgi:hypothetical protein
MEVHLTVKDSRIISRLTDLVLSIVVTFRPTAIRSRW